MASFVPCHARQTKGKVAFHCIRYSNSPKSSFSPILPLLSQRNMRNWKVCEPQQPGEPAHTAHRHAWSCMNVGQQVFACVCTCHFPFLCMHRHTQRHNHVNGVKLIPELSLTWQNMCHSFCLIDLSLEALVDNTTTTRQSNSHSFQSKGITS